MIKGERKKQLRNKKRYYIFEYLLSHPCEKCWENRPVCLEFHHQWDKEIDISKAYDWSIQHIQKEIEKCQVLCSNCHKIVTSKEQWRYSFLNYPEFNGQETNWPMMSS